MIKPMLFKRTWYNAQQKSGILEMGASAKAVSNPAVEASLR